MAFLDQGRGIPRSAALCTGQTRGLEGRRKPLSGVRPQAATATDTEPRAGAERSSPRTPAFPTDTTPGASRAWLEPAPQTRAA